jgi:hypothetical protein
MSERDEKFLKLVEETLSKFGNSITDSERTELRSQMYAAANDSYEIGYLEGLALSTMLSKVSGFASKNLLDKFLQRPDIKKYQEACGVDFEEHRNLLEIMFTHVFFLGSQLMVDYNAGTKTYDGLVEVVKEMKF